MTGRRDDVPADGPADEPPPELWADLLEGELDEDGLRALDARLADDPAAAAAAADLYEEHRLLAFALRPFDPAAFVRAVGDRIRADGADGDGRFVAAVVDRCRDEVDRCRDDVDRCRDDVGASRPPRFGRFRVSVAACAVAATAVLTAVSFWPRPGGDAPDGPAVATLRRAGDCRWAGGAAAVGDRVGGKPLTLERGTAVFAMDGGALLRLEGPGRVELLSPTEARLTAGRATVRAEEEAAGFVLRTAAADVVDLGTEFVVVAESAGGTLVHVLEGEVEWYARAADAADRPGGPRSLAGGQAVRVRPDGRGEPVDSPPPAVSLAAAADRPAADRPAADRPAADRPAGRGRLVAADAFDYPFARTPTRDRAADGGRGWDGPWFRGWPDSPRAIRFAPGPDGSPALRFVAEPDRGRYTGVVKRRLADPLRTDRDGDVYLAFTLLRRAPPPGGGSGDNRDGGFGVILVSSADLPRRSGFRVMSDGRPLLRGPGGNAAGVVPVPDGEPVRVVVRLRTRRDGADRLSAVVLPPRTPPPPAPPTVWPLEGVPADFPARLDQIHLGNGPRRGYLLDDLRVGTGWAAVVNSTAAVGVENSSRQSSARESR